jgi:mRNA-degrading endonuclease RelE of RelBE toxin-antitoxin system
VVFGIRKITRLGRFKKAYRQLSEQNKQAVDDALRELRECDPLPKGRRLEKAKSRKDTWAIRINRGIRLTFEVSDGICTLRNVGEHDKILDDP